MAAADHVVYSRPDGSAEHSLLQDSSDIRLLLDERSGIRPGDRAFRVSPSRVEDAAEESALLFWSDDAQHGGRGLEWAVMRFLVARLNSAATGMASGTDDRARIVVSGWLLDPRKWF